MKNLIAAALSLSLFATMSLTAFAADIIRTATRKQAAPKLLTA